MGVEYSSHKTGQVENPFVNEDKVTRVEETTENPRNRLCLSETTTATLCMSKIDDEDRPGRNLREE